MQPKNLARFPAPRSPSREHSSPSNDGTPYGTVQHGTSTRAVKRPRAPHYQPFDPPDSSFLSAVVAILSMVAAAGCHTHAVALKVITKRVKGKEERDASPPAFSVIPMPRAPYDACVVCRRPFFYLLAYQTFTRSLSPGQGLISVASSKDYNETASVVTLRMRCCLGVLVRWVVFLATDR